VESKKYLKGLLYYNIYNFIGLGINVAGTAANFWKLLTNLYNTLSELAFCILKNNLGTYISGIEIIFQIINRKIRNISFYSIVFSFLSVFWDFIVMTLYATTSSIDIIAQLNTH